MQVKSVCLKCTVDMEFLLPKRKLNNTPDFWLQQRNFYFISQKESLIIVNKSAFLCHKSANRCPFRDPWKLDSFSAKLFITKQSELNEFLTTLVIKIKKIN